MSLGGFRSLLSCRDLRNLKLWLPPLCWAFTRGVKKSKQKMLSFQTIQTSQLTCSFRIGLATGSPFVLFWILRFKFNLKTKMAGWKPPFF